MPQNLSIMGRLNVLCPFMGGVLLYMANYVPVSLIQLTGGRSCRSILVQTIYQCTTGAPGENLMMSAVIMYVYVYTYVCTYVCMNVCTYVCSYVSTSVSVRTCTCMYVYTSIDVLPSKNQALCEYCTYVNQYC